MENIMNLAGLSTIVLDFTDDLSPLLVGLVCLVGLSGGMIAWSAVRHYWSEKTKLALQVAPTSADHQEAA